MAGNHFAIADAFSRKSAAPRRSKLVFSLILATLIGGIMIINRPVNSLSPIGTASPARANTNYQSGAYSSNGGQATVSLAAPTANSEEIKAAIRQVLDAQVAAWNSGSLEGFMAGYWQSPDLSFFSGTNQTRGWQPTLDRYRKRYQSEGREMGKLSFNDLEIQPLSAESAFVRGRWQLVLSKETVGGLFTLVLQKRPEGWRVIHDHTS